MDASILYEELRKIDTAKQSPLELSLNPNRIINKLTSLSRWIVINYS